MPLLISQRPAFTTNYHFIAHCTDSGITAVIDPGDPMVIQDMLDAHGWRPDMLLITHHHWDHTDGIPALVARYGCPVYAPAAEQKRIPATTHPLYEGDRVSVGIHVAEVLALPGHTLGHIGFYFAHQQVLFCGDTLFSLGCGRLFEGTPAQMWQSLCRLRALPDATQIYCAHEYTESNARFAMRIDPHNQALQAYVTQVCALRAEGKPTIPCHLATEKEANPFLRADISRHPFPIKMPSDSPLTIFTWLRQQKDHAT